MQLSTREKTLFLGSAAFLVWLFGFVTAIERWFPSEYLVRAWQQARAVNPTDQPVFLHQRFYERWGVRTVSADRMQAGLTVITSSWGESGDIQPGMRLIDRKGNVLHEWRVDPDELFTEVPTGRRVVSDLDIQGSYLFPNGDVLVNLEYAGTLRLDACGETKWRLLEGGHHSIARAEDGSFWIPGVSSETMTDSPGHPGGFPGIRRPVYHDRILRISEAGEVLQSIDVLDVLYRNGLQSHLAEERQTSNSDPTHLNDVEPLPASMADEYPLFEAGDLVVSLRHLDLIFVMDPDSEQIKWHSSSPHILQHDPDFVGDGWIGIFDNRTDGTARGTMLGGSRILAIQPHTDSMTTLFPASESEPFFTYHRGKWQQLENGNRLLTEEQTARVVEVDPAGRTVWEWIHSPHEQTSVPSVTKATRVDLTAQDVAEWPCSPDDSVGHASR